MVKWGEIVIRVFVIRYSGIIVCAGGGVRLLFDVISRSAILRCATIDMLVSRSSLDTILPFILRCPK